MIGKQSRRPLQRGSGKMELMSCNASHWGQQAFCSTNVATITVIFFSFNKVSHARTACLPLSMLQPLQSVCQPSLIQTEIFLSVGSLLSVKGAPPPRTLITCLLDMLHCHHGEIHWMWMVTPELGFSATPLTSEMIHSMYFQSCVMNVSEKWDSRMCLTERTPIWAYFWWELSTKVHWEHN